MLKCSHLLVLVTLMTSALPVSGDLPSFSPALTVGEGLEKGTLAADPAPAPPPHPPPITLWLHNCRHRSPPAPSTAAVKEGFCRNTEVGKQEGGVQAGRKPHKRHFQTPVPSLRGQQRPLGTLPSGWFALHSLPAQASRPAAAPQPGSGAPPGRRSAQEAEGPAGKAQSEVPSLGPC